MRNFLQTLAAFTFGDGEAREAGQPLQQPPWDSHSEAEIRAISMQQASLRTSRLSACLHFMENDADGKDRDNQMRAKRKADWKESSAKAANSASAEAGTSPCYLN